MKKMISILFGVLAGTALMAAGLSQLSVTMSTEGPDFYADGTPVQTGETYLLVYVYSGTGGFKGIYMDGSLVDPENNRKVIESQAVAGSKCGFKAIQYPAGMYPAGGDFVIVLLDTRSDSGAVGGLVSGQAAVVTGQAADPDAAVSTLALRVAAESGDGPALTTGGLPAVRAGTPAPVISALETGGDAVQVRIRNFVPGVNYRVESTTDLAGGAWQPALNASRVNAQQNLLPGGGELGASVAKPANDAVRFFRVIVPGEVK